MNTLNVTKKKNIKRREKKYNFSERRRKKIKLFKSIWFYRENVQMYRYSLSLFGANQNRKKKSFPFSCYLKNNIVLQDEQRKYAFMISLCAIYILVVAELLNGFSCIKEHYDTCMCHMHAHVNVVHVIVCVCVHVHCRGSKRTFSDCIVSHWIFIEHQHQLNESTPYDFVPCSCSLNVSACVYTCVCVRFIVCTFAGNKKA